MRLREQIVRVQTSVIVQRYSYCKIRGHVQFEQTDGDDGDDTEKHENENESDEGDTDADGTCCSGHAKQR